MTLSDSVRAALEDAAQTIVEATYVTALAGAGMSAESGIPTFRGPGGLWTKYGEPDNLGYQRFLRDPRQWWEERLNDNQMRKCGTRWSRRSRIPAITRWLTSNAWARFATWSRKTLTTSTELPVVRTSPRFMATTRSSDASSA